MYSVSPRENSKLLLDCLTLQSRQIFVCRPGECDVGECVAGCVGGLVNYIDPSVSRVLNLVPLKTWEGKSTSVTFKFRK